MLHWQTSVINTGRSKPIIKSFDSGWNYIKHVFFKLISHLVIWSWKYNNMLKKKITSLQTSVIRACRTTLNIFPHWISKTCIRKHKNHSKASSGAEKFSQSLQACKKLQYNIRNCKLGRHNQHHTCRRRKSRYNPTSTNIPYYNLKIKGGKNENTKNPSPH